MKEKEQKVVKEEKKKEEIENNQKGQGSKIIYDDIITSKIPKTLKKYALSLLIFLKDKKIITNNSEGEIKLKKRLLTKSNLTALIFHALTNTLKKPYGYKLFYRELRKFKIPNFLKEKNNLKKYTSDKMNDEWRPPGKLYKKKKSVK